MKVKIVTRSGREVIDGGLEVTGSTVDDLQAQIHELSQKKKLKGIKAVLYPSRQRMTIPATVEGGKPVPLAAGKKLSDFAVMDGTVITLKDLGIQIGYQTVFFWEYFGPLLVYPIFACGREVVYGTNYTPCLAQRLALWYFVFHYTKRIAETFLVHTFSHATMPIANLFRNCGYYWGFAALVSYFINHPDYTSPDEMRVKIFFGLAMVCQLCNLSTHITLSNLRKPGEKGYKIPKGFGFNMITCANYTFEIYGWFCFNVATQSLMGVMFMTAGALQMIQWAGQKHARLRKQFDGKEGREKYPRRWIILPPFI